MSKAKGNFPTSSAREEALKTLLDWGEKKQNLDRLNQVALSRMRKENRAFYLELVKGTVRNLSLLDYKLADLLKHPLSSLPCPIRDILRIGLYQLDFLDIPKPVTVHLMVDLSKLYGHEGTVRLVNGVLRKAAQGYVATFSEDPLEKLCLVYSHPKWLVERWVARFGFEDTKRLLEWNNSIPELDVRINRTRITSEDFLEICKSNQVQIFRSEFKEAFSLTHSGQVDKLPGYSEGFFWIQSRSALLPALLLNPKPGEKILDLCAAPGIKSCQMAEMMEDRGEILAIDVHEERLKKIEENQRRLGFHCVRPVLGDGREVGKLFPGLADAILLDAPCSATGSFRRKVDAKWNKTSQDLNKNSKLQIELLESAAAALKPGGRMVYATCSIEPEENQTVVRNFLDLHPEFVGEEQREILPHRDQRDGFFLAGLRKC